MEPLESRQLLSASISPLLAPDRGGFGGFGGYGGGGYGGGGYGGGGYGGGGGSGYTPVNTSAYYVPANGYSPSQITTAYGINQLTVNGAAATGAGETIAIVDAYNDPNIVSDLKTFDTKFDLAGPPSFTQVSQTGGSVSSIQTDAGWGQEISLDVEWAHAIAPGASIELVEAKNDNTNNLIAAVNYARNSPGVVAVSMSWGGSEMSNQSQYDTDFTTPAGHVGVTFVAAAGDSTGAEWPASSPNVVGVGGTSLYALNSTGAYGLETSWSSTGGGDSSVVKEPSYQEVAQTSGARSTPDVSYDADPNTGFQVYDSLSYDGSKGWQEIGGTSAGTPQWAAIFAITDQIRASKGQTSLDGATQTLPMLYSDYSAPSTTGYAAYALDFHDVSEDGSRFSVATAGYDLTTGLGTPDAGNLVATFVSAGTVSKSSITAKATTTTAKSAAKAKSADVTDYAPNAGTTEQPTGQIFGYPGAPTFVSFAPGTPASPVAPAPVASHAVAQPAFNADSAAAPATGAPDNGTIFNDSALGVTAAAATGDTLDWTAPNSGTIRLPLKSVLKDQISSVSSAQGIVATEAAAASTSAAQVVRAELAQAAAAINATAQIAVKPHVWLELAQLDASIFSDSLRMFVSESATLATGAGPTNRLARPLEIAAASVLADAIIIGYWYQSRSRKNKKGAEVQPQG